MTENTPRVSIGMPVYNGANFIAEALESIQAQTFQDFEVVISDNASTDETEAICRDLAERDPRIRYYRQPKNLGSGVNHNQVFLLSRGEYFKWFSHDDRCAPEFLAECIDVLDKEPSVVICYPSTAVINEHGERSENPYKRILQDDAPSPSRRFREMAWYEHLCFPIYGLMRAEVVRKNPVMGCYVGGDNVLLARLALHGPFKCLPSFLFFNRDHKSRSTSRSTVTLEKRLRLTNHGGWLPRKSWWDTSAKDKVTFPYWRMFGEYVASIGPAPVAFGEKVKCYLCMLPWLGKYGKRMVVDVVIAMDTLLAPALRVMSRFTMKGNIEERSL